MPPYQPEPINVIPNTINQSGIDQLIELLHVYPEDGPIQKPPGAGDLVHWRNLEIGKSYWALSTGFGCTEAPRQFTVTDISHFPDGGAMIWTDDPMYAYGVGAYCESAIGPRNRFWTTYTSDINA